MSGYVKRRANNQRRRMLTKKWRAGWRPVDHVPVAMELNAHYRSLSNITIGMDGALIVTGINEEGKRIEETTRLQTAEVADFDTMLERYGLKNLLRSVATVRLQIAHVRAKSTIRELGEDLADDLIRGLRPNSIIIDELRGMSGWDAWEQTLRNSENELVLGAVIKDLNKLTEELMDTKKIEEKKSETTNCENCSAEVEVGKTLQCVVCGMDGLGPCCIAIDDHPCEDAEEEDEG